MPELIFHGGTVLTQDPRRPRAQALSVADRRIVAVGDDADVLHLARPGTRRIDLGGRTLVPGFCDAHAHIWKIGHLLTTMVDLRPARSLGEIAALLQRAAARLPDGAWLQGRGYNESRLAEARAPTRADLDAAVADRPVLLTRACGHIYACNSAALRACAIGRETPEPAGGVIVRDERGEPTGLLQETAMGLVNRRLPPPGRDALAAMVRAALRHQLALGITASTDAGVAPELLAAYRALDADDALPARVNVMALRRVEGVGTVPLPESYVSDHLRIDTVKFLADGGLSGATAALSVPYRGRDSRGVLRFEDDELLELAGEAHRAGWRIATHAIGDVAIDQVLGTYERLGRGPRRHRIEHLGLPSPAQLSRAAELDVIAVPQSIFLRELGRNFRDALDQRMLERAYPLRSMLDAGLTVALSSDAPVVEDDDPLAGMVAAIDRRDAEGVAIAPSEAIAAEEALHAYTLGGAIASGDDAERGSLEQGKWADLAVLSADPTASRVESLAEIRVDQTWVAGRLAFER